MNKIFKLKNRKEFLRVANAGFKMVSSTLILQAAQSLCADNVPAKIGYTTTKKLGKANVRNLSRRRMRAAVRETMQSEQEHKFLPNFEYVLIGRHNTAECDFAQLKRDLSWSLKKIHKIILEKEDENSSDSAR